MSTASTFDDFKEKVLEAVNGPIMGKTRLRKGMPAQELKSKFKYVDDPKFFNILFNRLEKEGASLSRIRIL